MIARLRSRRRRAAASRRPRRGTTMIELVVALMILSVGMLSLTSGAVLLSRLMNGGAIQSRVATTANSRMEKIRATSCASISSGADTVRGIVSRWTTQPITFIGTRRGVGVNLVLTYQTSRGNRTQTFQTIVPC
jgi:prepilin-type N-terminal cleavage/methylation domain-containing protein